MKVKRVKHNVADAIIGMTIVEAKIYCTSENYVLSLGDKPNTDVTYLVTVTELGSDGKILNAKYGK